MVVSQGVLLHRAAAGIGMHQIRYFLALASTENFTRAAEECHVSQPALTRAIKQLETALGGDLFYREAKHSRLTPLGLATMPHLKRCYESALGAKCITANPEFDFNQRGQSMSRIPTPDTVEAAPASAQPLLDAVKKQLGSVPNMFRLIANSPAALEGYLGMSGALSKGALPPATRERIALAVAEINGCSYCLSAHTYLGKKLAKLDEGEIAANRKGSSMDPKAAAAVRFAANIVRMRGQVGVEDIQAVKAAGYDDAQVLEIVLHVALNTWTNYVNEVFKTDVDFPVVMPGSST